MPVEEFQSHIRDQRIFETIPATEVYIGGRFVVVVYVE
jgi:hypothetical protein